MQASCRVAKQDIGAARFRGLNGVIDNSRRIRAFRLFDDMRADALSHTSSWSIAPALNVSPAKKNDIFAFFNELMGKLADRRRFADAVDADE